jgi:hypothetical protein
MKKITLAILGLFIAGSFATAQLQFGVKGGLSLAKMVFDPDPFEGVDIKMNTGFQAGVFVGLGLPMGLELETGIGISQKGFKIDESIGGFDVKITFAPVYVDVPLILNYKIDAGPAAVFFGAGPVISYGIAGKIKTEAGGEEDSADIEWGDEGDLKALDFGLGIQAGAQLSKLRVTASYNLGLADISVDSDISEKNQVIGLTVAYLF